MAAASKSYSNTSIEVLKGADRVRKRPAVIFGSDGIEGCEHSVFEIIANSVDEAREGYGKQINVTYYKDLSVEVEDFGRGIPMDYNEREKAYNWKLLFCEMYAGGKYNNSDNTSYGYSLGTNGLGLCATQYSSQYMDVEVCRDGCIFNMSFKAGKPVGELIKAPLSKRRTGSRIKWRPDIKVFTDISIPDEYFLTVLKQQSVVNAGVTFNMRFERDGGRFEEYNYFYADGIADYMRECCDNENFTEPQQLSAERVGRDREDKSDYRLKMNFVFCFSRTKQMLEYYHNGSFLEHGGSPDRAVKSAFVAQIDALIKDRKLYKKDESKISFVDVQECLMLVSSSFSTETSYENQTKKAITNRFIATAMAEFLKHSLEIYFIENRAEADKIAEQVLINKRSRENAEHTRQTMKKIMQNSADMSVRVQKFVDCRSKDLSRREVYIVEGDSALGACKQGRDAEFQAIIPVRGKILNCLKADYGKIFKNEIITDLIKVLGCGVAVQSKANKDLSTFDIDNLRWNKVIICTDADVDGYQIRVLILTMLYRLTPLLIEQGYVYIAESPLFEINSREKTYFAYDEQEKIEILKKLEGKKFTIQRSKGLGENEPEMMWMTTMNPKTRRLIRVSPTDARETAEMFELLQGDNLAGRKEYIARYGADYLDDLDVS